MDKVTRSAWGNLINLLDDSDFRDNYKGGKLINYLNENFFLVKKHKYTKLTKK
jgi:hypothetical protein